MLISTARNIIILVCFILYVNFKNVVDYVQYLFFIGHYVIKYNIVFIKTGIKKGMGDSYSRPSPHSGLRIAPLQG